jgi:hypothetical protein
LFILLVALVSPTEPSTTGSAPRKVQWQSKAEAAPHKETCQCQAVMRFLRFQAPWAYGRTVFVLLPQHAGGQVGEYS